MWEQTKKESEKVNWEKNAKVAGAAGVMVFLVGIGAWAISSVFGTDSSGRPSAGGPM